MFNRSAVDALALKARLYSLPEHHIFRGTARHGPSHFLGLFRKRPLWSSGIEIPEDRCADPKLRCIHASASRIIGKGSSFRGFRLSRLGGTQTEHEN